MTYTTKFATLGVAACLFLAACNNSTTESTETHDSTTVAVDAPPADTMQNTMNNAPAPAANSDSEFVMNAAMDNNMELKLLEQGNTKGTNKDLKSHAKMMIADHKKLGSKMADYAKKKNYTLPQDDGGKSAEKMTTLDQKAKGADWDKAFIDEMVAAHENAVSMFEAKSANATDPELKQVVDGALPTLRSHRDMVKQMQDKMNK